MKTEKEQQEEKMPHLKEIGARIRQIRKSFNQSQKEFGEKMDVSSGSLSEIENGKYRPGLDLVVRLAKEFNVNLYYLVLGEGEMFIDPTALSLTRIEEFAVNVDHVKEFLHYFQGSTILQYDMLNRFKAQMLKEKDIILKDIEKTEKERSKPSHSK